MRVVVANNIYPPFVAGGAELIVAYLCEGLARRGHDVTVVSTCGPEMEPYPAETRNGVEVIRFFPPNLYWSFKRSRAPGIEKWLWHARDAWNRQAGRRFRAVLESVRPDVVHTHVVDGMSASIWAHAKSLGIPVIHTAHDYHLLCPRAFMLTAEWKLCLKPKLPCQVYRRWHLGTTRFIDRFVSPSRFLLRMHEESGMSAPQRDVVHNGIPQLEGTAGVRDARPPESRFRFLMLTRLTPEKGVGVALDAFARLPRDLPVELMIAGRGPLEERACAAAAADARIRYLGYIEGAAKAAALSRAGYLLLPSLWYENAPVVIVEAAAYGLGLIGSDFGAIPEFVEPGRTGLLFPPGDPAALAAIVIRIAQGPQALPDLATRSAALARRFTVDRMVGDYEAQYQALLERRPVLAAAS